MTDPVARRQVVVDHPHPRRPSCCSVPSSSAGCDHLNCGCSEEVFITRSTSLPLPAHMKYIDVQLLTLQHLYVAVDVKCRLRDIFHCVCNHAGIADARMFGLSLFVQNEYRFLDPVSKLSKCTPKNWSKSGGWGTDMTGQPSVILYLRVHTFVDTVRLITCPMSLLHYYMQLRENMRVQWKENVVREEHCFEVVALALQADYGDYCPSLEPLYFRPDSYFPRWIVAKRGFDFLCRHTPAMHKEYKGLPPQEARYRFCELVSCPPSAVDIHLYSLKKTKYDTTESIRLAVGPAGIEISEIVADQYPKFVSFLLWSSIRKLSFDRQKYSVHSVNGNRMVFYAVDEQKSRYLFQFCRAVHQNLILLRSDIVAAKSKIMTEKTTFRESYISSDLSDMQNMSMNKTDGDNSCNASNDSVKVTPNQTNGGQRISLVSDASSNTTSGIVSDKQVPHDDSENENENGLEVDGGGFLPSTTIRGEQSMTPLTLTEDTSAKTKQPPPPPPSSASSSSLITIHIDGTSVAAAAPVSTTSSSSGYDERFQTSTATSVTAGRSLVATSVPPHPLLNRERPTSMAFSACDVKHLAVDIPEIRRKTLNAVVTHNSHTLDKIIYPVVTFAPSSLSSPTPKFTTVADTALTATPAVTVFSSPAMKTDWFKVAKASSSSLHLSSLKNSLCELVATGDKSVFPDNMREPPYGRPDLGRFLPKVVNGCYQRETPPQPMLLDGSLFVSRCSPPPPPPAAASQRCEPRLSNVSSLLHTSSKHSNSLLNIPCTNEKFSGGSMPPNYEQALRQKAERQGKRWTTVTGIDPSFLSQVNVLTGQLVQTHSEPGLGGVHSHPSATVFGTEAEAFTSTQVLKGRENGRDGRRRSRLWRKDDYNNNSGSDSRSHTTLSATNISASTNGMLRYDLINGSTVSRAHSMQEQATSTSTQRLTKDFHSQERRSRYCTTCCEDHAMVEKIDLAKLKSMIRSNGIDLPLIRALCNDRSLQPSSSSPATVGDTHHSHFGFVDATLTSVKPETVAGSSSSANPEFSLFPMFGRPLSLQEGSLFQCGGLSVSAAETKPVELLTSGQLDRGLYEKNFDPDRSSSSESCNAVNSFNSSGCCFVSVPNLLDRFVVPPPPYPCHLPLKDGAQFSISAACEATR